MLSPKIKTKILLMLSDGPKTKTIIGDTVRNRTPEYKAAFNEWLSGVVTDSYTMNYRGPATTIYCISPEGVRQLEALKERFSDL